jgi:predicted permease
MSIASWLKRITRRRLDDDDFAEEIRAHLAIAADERMADGAGARDAQLAARKEFGNLALTTEAAHRVWTPRWLEALGDLARDVRYAVRSLAKKPGFAITVVAVLAIGIGLNAAVFTMLKSLALHPVADVPAASDLAVVYGETSSGRAVSLSYPEFQHLRGQDRAFVDLMGSTVATVGLGRGRDSRSIFAELVTGNYFDVLGVRAEQGRVLMPSDASAPGRDPVVVISDGLWRRDFGADPAIVGRTIDVNNLPLTVVGVADPAFHGTTVVYDVEVYIPITMGPDLGFRFGSLAATASAILSDRRAELFYPSGYLRPGTTLADAGAQTAALWPALARERAIGDPAMRLRVVPFRESPDGAPMHILPVVSVLSAMGLFVLLIACANIAGLVLVRGASRRGEIAMRLALGASRARVVRLLVAESLVLAVPGAVLGVLLASWGIPVLVGYAEGLAAPQRVFFNVGVDRLVIVFAALIACGSAVAFGLVPALRGSKVDLATAINEDASPRGAARGRLRAALVVAQVAVSLLLLVGAGLATRSFEAARAADPGYDARRVASVALDLKEGGYDEARGRVFYRKLLDAARGDDGTESATLAAYPPLHLLETPATRVEVGGYEARRGEDLAFMYNTVAPDYFRSLRIPLLSGREFEARDDERAAPVAIVNRTFAERFWGGAGQALGQRVRVRDEWRTVVGVAADVKYQQIDEAPRPYLYLPFLQAYRPNMLLHTRGAAAAPGSDRSSVDALIAQARAHIAALDPNLPILKTSALADEANGALMFLNLAATMLFVFGIAGIVLAAMGTYGLVSYAVDQSTHEIGIRMALGARALSIVRRYVGGGLRLAALGAVLGLSAALALGRLIGTVLFGVSPTDPVSFARALGIVLGIVALATIVPAWRAARVDPLRALRHQ